MNGVPGGIIAVIRTSDPEQARVIAEGLAVAGVDALEITLTIPDAVEVIRQISRSSPIPVGAGTVRTDEQVRAVVAAGAEFVVSPDTRADVIAAARAVEVPAVAGALTPTEATTAVGLGASAVKLFPISAVGGPSYVRAVLEPLPELILVVSGGIGVGEVGDYLAAGVRAVCLGGALIDRSAAADGDVAAVTAYARRTLAQLGRA